MYADKAGGGSQVGGFHRQLSDDRAFLSPVALVAASTDLPCSKPKYLRAIIEAAFDG